MKTLIKDLVRGDIILHVGGDKLFIIDSIYRLSRHTGVFELALRSLDESEGYSCVKAEREYLIRVLAEADLRTLIDKNKGMRTATITLNSSEISWPQASELKAYLTRITPFEKVWVQRAEIVGMDSRGPSLVSNEENGLSSEMLTMLGIKSPDKWSDHPKQMLKNTRLPENDIHIRIDPEVRIKF